jgi:hypothetical protein
MERVLMVLDPHLRIPVVWQKVYSDRAALTVTGFIPFRLTLNLHEKKER